jgi:hypothetical protein
MRPDFETGALQPFPVKDDHVFGLDAFMDAYALGLEGKTRDRIYIAPRA